MSSSRSKERLIRWYPPKWRDRYGEEMIALLSDTHGSRRIQWRTRWSLVRNGSRERVREAGLVGETASSTERLKAGSLLIICCWALFIVAGAIFAKFSEQWDVATPIAGRHLASIAYDVVQWSGEAGVALVIVAAIFVAPSLARFVRGGGWTNIRRSVVRTSAFLAFVSVATAGLGLWAHHLSSPQRNGGLALYEVVFVLWAISIAVVIGSGTCTIVAVTRAVPLSKRVTRLGALVAIVLTLVMVSVAAGTATWWIAEARYAPSVLGGHDASRFLGAPTSLPPALLLAGTLMLLAIAAALSGVPRMARAFYDY